MATSCIAFRLWVLSGEINGKPAAFARSAYFRILYPANVPADDISDRQTMAAFQLSIDHIDLFARRVENFAPTISRTSCICNEMTVTIYAPPGAIIRF